MWWTWHFLTFLSVPICFVLLQKLWMTWCELLKVMTGKFSWLISWVCEWFQHVARWLRSCRKASLVCVVSCILNFVVVYLVTSNWEPWYGELDQCYFLLALWQLIVSVLLLMVSASAYYRPQLYLCIAVADSIKYRVPTWHWSNSVNRTLWCDGCYDCLAITWQLPCCSVWARGKSFAPPLIPLLLVLLWWQEFATRSVAMFFDRPSRCRWRWRISVGVETRVVNRKQVDVTASRSDRSGCPGMR